jgi:hypothetical protein
MSLLFGAAHITQFITAGNATFTLRSRKTGQRFTYNFTAKPEAGLTFVKVLSGPDNTADYTYMGMIRSTDPHILLTTRASRVTPDALSWRVLAWFLRAVYLKPDTLDQVEVFHEGRCGRCGRKLTVPESIESGFGPECINLV